MSQVSRPKSQAAAGGSPSHVLPYAELQAKLEELEDYTHTALIQFPKLERHLLCADIRSSLAAVQRLTVVAWKRHHKKTALQDLDVEIEVLRGWVRKSLRRGYINPHRYETWARHINDVGRMVGGWIKSMQQA